MSKHKPSPRELSSQSNPGNLVEDLLERLNQSYDKQEELIQQVSSLVKMLDECSSLAARKSIKLEDLEKSIREPGRN